MYEWKTGHAPANVGTSDDYLPKMLEQERKHVESLKAESEQLEQEIDVSREGNSSLFSLSIS